MVEKEVKNQPQKKNLNLTILNLLKQGKSPSNISKELSISMPNLAYYLRKLKENGFIKKIGYGTWEVKNLALTTLPKKNKVRGHAFIWKVRIPKEIRGLIQERLTNIGFTQAGKTKRIIINNKKLWIGKENIIVYEHKSFYGDNSIESRKYAVIELIEALEGLERALQVKLRPYVFQPKREHYGLIKNELARQCNRNKEKIIIRDNLEGEWLWIDDSDSLGELETGGNKALVRNVQVQKWFNDMKKHNFEVTPSFTLNAINQLTNNLNYHAENMVSHVEAVKILGSAVEDLVVEVKELRKQNEEMSKLLQFSNKKDN